MSIALVQSNGDVGCYLQGLTIGFDLYGVLASILAYKGFLGGIGGANSMKKLIMSLAVYFTFGRVLPTSTIGQCI